MQEWKKTYQLLRPFFRGLPIILLIMIGALIAAERYLRYATPMYESAAKIKLADPQQGSPSTNLYKDFDVFVHTNKIGAEVEMLKSKVLIGKAIGRADIGITISRVGKIRKTELYHRSPIKCLVRISEPSWLDKPILLHIFRDSLYRLTGPDGQILEGIMDHPLETPGGQWLISRNIDWLSSHPHLIINDHYEIIVHSPEKLIDQIATQIDVSSVDKDIPVLRISYKSPVPEKAADVVNAIAKAYIQDYVEEKFRTADTTLGFLDQQLSAYSNMLAGSENKIETYRDENNIINIKQETETDLRKISDLKKQLASVQMNLMAIDSLNRYMDRGRDNFLAIAPNFEAFTDLLSTEIIKKTKQLQSEKRDLLTRYTPEHEKVKVVDDKIADLAGYLRESIRNTQSNLQIKYQDLNQTIAEAETAFIGLPTKEKKLTIMEREFSLNEEIYRFLHQKRTEAEIARAAKISFHRIISPAEVSKVPVSPNSMPIRIVAGLLGLLAGIAFIYTLHLLKGRVSDETLIHRNAETPLVIAIPQLARPDRIVPFFQRWVVQMELRQWLGKGQLISINSHIQGEGKRYLATHLARALAAQGRKILVIDTDGALSDTALSGEFDYLNISGAPFLSSPALAQAQCQQWREQYDLIVCKNAPLLKQADALVVMAIADLNLMLIDSRKTIMARLYETDQMSRELNLSNMRLVFNRAGYSPSLIKEIWNVGKKLIAMIKTGITFYPRTVAAR